MKSTIKSLLTATVAALLAVTLYGSAVRRASGEPTQDRVVTIAIPDSAKPEAFEKKLTNGQTTGMTVIKKGGAREIMQPQPDPACGSGCPAGQRMVCWTDHDAGMSICECQGGGGGGGGGGPSGQITLESYSW